MVQLNQSLLSEDSGGGSEAPLDHFPCIADDLEEQAKQLEEEWFCPSQSPTAAAAAAAVAEAQQSVRLSAAALGPPALRHSALEALQQQLALQAEQARQQQQQQQRWARQQEHSVLTVEEQQGEATVHSSGGEEPCTPQCHSKSLCWSELSLPGSSLDEYAEVQSPAPAKLMALPSPADSHTTCSPPLPSLPTVSLPPLTLAINNAQRVRLGQEATPCAWRGCGRSPLCSLAPLHRTACDAAAVLPGLLAYPAGELFESGVNIEELCRMPAELLGGEGALAFGEAEAEGEGGGDCLSSGHKRAWPEGEAADDGADHSGGCGGTTSSSSPAEVSQRQQQQQHAAAVAAATAAVKRMRTDASSASTLAAFPLAAVTGAVLQPSPAAVAVAEADASAAAAAAAACPRMVPVEVLAPLHLLAPPVPLPLPSLGSAVARNWGRPAGAPRLRPLPCVDTPPPPPPAPMAVTPSKPVTRQKQQKQQSTHVAVAPGVPHTCGRKAALQWHTESVTDPRTGAAVSEVHPGSFCTQCHTLRTPVWRAGPFGHKTLCNACGLRWVRFLKGLQVVRGALRPAVKEKKTPGGRCPGGR